MCASASPPQLVLHTCPHVQVLLQLQQVVCQGVTVSLGSAGGGFLHPLADVPRHLLHLGGTDGMGWAWCLHPGAECPLVQQCARTGQQ